MSRWPSSIRERLSLLYAGGLGLLLLLFGAGAYLAVRTRLLQELRDHTRQDLEMLAHVLAEEGLGTPEELDEQVFVPFVLFDQTGAPLYASADWRDLGLPLTSAELAKLSPEEQRDRRGHGLKIASANYPVGGTDVQVWIALDRSEMDHTLWLLLGVLGAGAILAQIGALFLGRWLAGRALAPAASLAAAARSVGARDPSARLPVGRENDEFDQLALEFNAVLERLQSAIDELRRFASNVSHELRTPLTAMRLVGEQALRRGADARSADSIGSMLEEIDRLVALIEQLLTLARAEGPEAKQCAVPVDLDAIVAETLSTFEVLAQEREQLIQLESGAHLGASAHPLLLRQAVSNLLDNAIRHTPPGGRIRVRVRSLPKDESAIEVVDEGPGIAAQDQARIFERFERLELATSGRGVGLGLSIARRAVESCGGRIELESALGVGSCFRIVLPRSAARDPRAEGRPAASQPHRKDTDLP